MASKLVGLALEVRGLAPRTKLVLVAIADATNSKDGRSFPSRKQLAEVAECSVDTVDRAVRELVAAGLLTVKAEFDDRPDMPKRQTTNTYILHLTPAAEMRPGGEQQDVSAAEMRPPQPHSYAAPPAAQDAAPIMNRKNEPEELTAAAAAAAGARAPFAEWKIRADALVAQIDHLVNRTTGGFANLAPVIALSEPSNGETPCDWFLDTTPAVHAVAQQLAPTQQRLRSWTHPRIAELARANRDRRLNPEPSNAIDLRTRQRPTAGRSYADQLWEQAERLAAAERKPGIG